MNIEPNSKLQYKDGKRRISILFGNIVEGKGIFFDVNIKQASQNRTFRGGYYIPSSLTVDAHPDTVEMLNAAIAANS